MGGGVGNRTQGLLRPLGLYYSILAGEGYTEEGGENLSLEEQRPETLSVVSDEERA